MPNSANRIGEYRATVPFQICCASSATPIAPTTPALPKANRQIARSPGFTCASRATVAGMANCNDTR